MTDTISLTMKTIRAQETTSTVKEVTAAIKEGTVIEEAALELHTYSVITTRTMLKLNTIMTDRVNLVINQEMHIESKNNKISFMETK
eukprot:GAHX01001890.1.p2 GENE.GAHX01001890.1~~GAHX01001890.1.p2  ORF type:complete len:87 (+),score=16.95 GAHX01001890.1:211-471(+)